MYSVVDFKSVFTTSLGNSTKTEDPYSLWQIDNVLLPEVVDELLDLKTQLTQMEYTLGRREENNDKRGYFDVERRENVPVCNAVSELFQDREIIAALEHKFDIDLAGTYLRIEFSQDSDGFWLEPHTDLGVKKFTMLLGLSKDEEAHTWGTSIYGDKDTLYENAPYKSNRAIIFVPSLNTLHGFEKRRINGIRKGLIINYVTDEWRARHELAFPENPIRT
ncbi:MAG: hypothetical protein COB93_11705 [Sneathiella sp.]|nr:MAG: hypothetical protein COB93_11705 [Sneathiella sp.]